MKLNNDIGRSAPQPNVRNRLVIKSALQRRKFDRYTVSVLKLSGSLLAARKIRQFSQLQLILLIFIAAVLGGCSRSEEDSQTEQAADEHRIIVSAETVQTGTFVVYGEYIGEANGILDVKLDVINDGKVAKVFAHEGDFVQAGQSLAEIDPEKAAKKYQTSVLDEKLARETYEREKRFLEEGNSFQLKVDQAHLIWLQAQSDLIEARDERDASFAITPISGTVIIRHIDPYDNLKAGDPTFEIADLSRIRISVDVPEADIAGVRELEEAEVVFSAYPDRVFVGRPTEFARGRTQQTLSYQVSIVVDNPDTMILSGQTARVKLVLRQFPNSISVPSRAVLIRSDGNYVFVIREDIAHEVQVQTGAVSNTRTLIESGLSADDTIVVDGFNRLADGELIEIHN